ncbi:MAG: translocation/assembly module TamB domain-containing protein [Bryobacterales bacterium]|nr:translocation/assembly module TamB domain-containing protein [Bryobacterales bacterium]
MKFAYRGTLVAVLLAGALCLAAFAVLESRWFHRYVHDRLIALIEENTGAKAEFGDYHIFWRQLRVRVQPFVLHGKEDPSRDPFVRVESAEIGLKILSLWKRDIDLRDFRAVRPELHIYVDKDGKTNVPSPRKPPSGKNPMEAFLRLAIDTVELSDGVAEYDSSRVPFSLNAQGVAVKMAYDHSGPAYRGEVAIREILLDHRYRIGFDSSFILEGNRVKFESGRLVSGTSTAQVQGTLSDFKHPAIELNYKASLNLKGLPVRPVTEGHAETEGVFSYSEKSGYQFRGHARATGLSAEQPEWRIRSADAASRYHLTAETLELEKTEVRAFGGAWQGKVRLARWRDFEVEGIADGLQLNELVRIKPNQAALPWNGALSGPVNASGRFIPGGIGGLVVSAQTKIEPLEGQLPVTGEVDASYDQGQGTLNLGASYFKTEDSRLTFRGILGRRLEVSFRTVNTAELEPLIRTLSGDESFQVPVTLSNGDTVFTGTVDGHLDDPRIRGRLTAHGVVAQGIVLDRIEADTTLSRNSLQIANGLIAQGDARISGNGRIALTDWRLGANPPVQAAFATRNVDVGRLLKENGAGIPIAGRLSGTVALEGTLAAPQAAFRFDLSRAEVYGDQFKHIAGRFQYDGGAGGRFQGHLALDEARFDLGGDYRHNQGDWRNGVLNLRVKLDRFDLAASERLQAHFPKVAGQAVTEFATALEIAGGQIRIRALDGAASVSNLGYGGQRIGDLSLTSATKGAALSVEGGVTLQSSRVTAAATVALAAGYPAKGVITSHRLTFRLLSELAGKDFGAEGPPVRGFVQVRADFQGPLLDPSKGSGKIVIEEAQFRPRDTQIGDTAVDSSEFTVRNEGPIELDVTGKGIQVKTAKLVAKDTDLSVDGVFQFNSKAPWDARLRGSINLGVLSTFNPDLVASGRSVISASLHGAADNPELSGRMEINNASFFLRDVPNGIDKAQGVILFDRNRATIEKLTGQTGGGTFDLKGFVSMARGEMLYRLQAIVSQVRIRYPEGVSTTFDADVSLTGSTTSSLLTGTVTVQRSGFNPRGDIGSIFREPNRPAPASVTENKYLRGMQFDVRVRSSANAFFQSSFTQETQIEADLRLRGSPAKPIVLGSLKANAGEVEFFGNRYTITRGELLFYNTAVIQPALDFDVETRIRGVTVYINVNGPLDRINVTYRSEPPLATNEIVALLTVGRTPGSLSGVPQGSTFQYGNVLEQSSNTLLGGALSGALSSRMEKFFGVSRVKIDPGVTSLEGTYQSRLTVEQSVSKDVTVTFSTNLAKTQQQVISAEWNINKAWSMVLTRDDNGAFSVEFRLRKQLK